MFKSDINYPKVSVIVPFYNSSETIDETLCSVEAQTYPSVEIIVVNDGSNEYHSNKLKQILSNRPHVQLVEQSNKGLASARNLGARQASGVYFCFLDSDDVIKPQYLSGCAEVLKDPKIKLVYTKAEFFGAREGNWNLPPYEGLKSILLGNRIPAVVCIEAKIFLNWVGLMSHCVRMKIGTTGYVCCRMRAMLCVSKMCYSCTENAQMVLPSWINWSVSLVESKRIGKKFMTNIVRCIFRTI